MPKSFTNHYSATAKALKSYARILRLEGNFASSLGYRKKKLFGTNSADTVYPPTAGKSYLFDGIQLFKGVSGSVS